MGTTVLSKYALIFDDPPGWLTDCEALDDELHMYLANSRSAYYFPEALVVAVLPGRVSDDFGATGLGAGVYTRGLGR